MSRRDLNYDWGERKRRAAVVQRWRTDVGDWCPGYGRSGHPATDLCADHVHPVATGGDPKGELGILCRSCNSSKREGRGRQAGTTPTGTWRCPEDPDNCHSTVRHSQHW